MATGVTSVYAAGRPSHQMAATSRASSAPRPSAISAARASAKDRASRAMSACNDSMSILPAAVDPTGRPEASVRSNVKCSSGWSRSVNDSW